MSKMRNTCFFIEMLLATFDSKFGRDLVFSGVDHHSLSADFLHFTNYLGGSRTRRSFLQLLWLLCVWPIWKKHNNFFNNICTSITELMEKVKFHSYWWLRANNVSFVYGC